MFHGVIVPPDVTLVRLGKVDSSQSLFGGGEVMDNREPCRLVGIRDPSCVEVGPQAFPVGMWIFANDTHLVAPLCVTVNVSNDLV